MSRALSRGGSQENIFELANRPIVGDTTHMSEGKDDKPTRKRLKPLSVHPLKAEDALSAFMKEDPAKVEQRLTESRKPANQPKASKEKPQD